jgi:hypothetical protein
MMLNYHAIPENYAFGARIDPAYAVFAQACQCDEAARGPDLKRAAALSDRVGNLIEFHNDLAPERNHDPDNFAI